MEYLIVLTLIGLVVFFFRKLSFVLQEEALNKEDIHLKNEQNDLIKEIKELKVKKPAPQLTPKEVEEFWSKK